MHQYPYQRYANKKKERTNARKRKRDETERVELDKRPFTIRPDPTDPFAAPRTFTPVCLLSRDQLPLAYLDTCSAGNRLFAASIRAFEEAYSSEDDAGILIAEEEKEKRLYAIERAQKRTYALCRLGTQVKAEAVRCFASAVAPWTEQPVKRQAVSLVEDGQPWWARAAVQRLDDRADLNESADSKPRLAMSRNDNVTVADELEAQRTAGDQPAMTSPVEVSQAVHQPLTMPLKHEEVLQELAKHYMEILYLSRTSLAYFIKGPLSRARAAFSNPSEGNLDMTQLMSFLREAVLTASTMDKKYRDGVAGVVKELSPVGLETPEPATKSKKKRKWKAKRDRGGFFSEEKEYLEQWWRSHDDAGNAPSSGETADAGLKRRLPRLRIRETYLQVILTLEVLALEGSLPPQSPPAQPGMPSDTETQGHETQNLESQAPSEERKQKTKKPQDLPALLDTLLDRLCIWHSLESHSPAKKGGAAGETENADYNDELKSFCVEVIIPFYMSRVPQHATTVNKKLGGPSAPTPVKRKTTSSRKPGEPAVRQVPEMKARKPLSRVSSEALNQISKRPIPGLHRSATDSDVLQQHIKREGSEAPRPLDSIPQAKPPQPRKRTNLMHSISFSRREVDLSAMSHANEAKMRKKADVEQKLREAITTLKKPNRTLAVKEVAENADLSFAKATARSRAPARPRTGAVTQDAGVHVAATPKHVRTVKATPGRRVATTRAELGSSGGATSCVPSSSARLLAQPHAQYDAPPTSSFAVPQTGHRPRHSAPLTGIEETPSRGFAKFMPPGLARPPGTLESPIAARHVLQETPVKPVRSLSLVPPVTAPLVVASPNTARLAPAGKEKAAAQGDVGGAKSIYDSLGWDDEEHYEGLA